MAVNLVFDLGNVLVRWDPVAITRSVVPGAGAVRLAEHLFAHPDWLEVDRGTMTLDEATARAVERTDVDEPIVAAAFAAVAPSLQPIPESVALLADLRQAGYPLYALSNMGAVSAAWLANNMTFWPWFQGRLISAEEHLVKPEAAIFERLCSRFGLKAVECIFIDDSQANVEAARQLGMQAIHFVDADSCREALLALGVRL